MIPLPEPNAISRPYRGLSIQETDVALHDEAAVLEHVRSREIYRRTSWLLLRNGADSALVAVSREDEVPLFSPVAEARVLAGPDRTRWVVSPDTDVGNATALAAAARALWAPDVDAYAVQGRYEHVNVIWRPQPVRVVVTEVVPPEPAKLFALAKQVVEFDEDLPPIDLVLDTVDIREIAQEHLADEYLLPCRGSGVDLPGQVAFLDTRPGSRREWLLIGCERSMQFHRHFYGDDPAQVDFCPRRRVSHAGFEDPVLTKCCLLERGVEHDDAVAVVPWGSNLDEIRLALRLLTGVGPVVEAAPIGASARP